MLPDKGAKLRIRYSPSGCHSIQHLLLSLSVLGCLLLSAVAANSILQQHTSQAESHSWRSFIHSMRQRLKWCHVLAIFHGFSCLSPLLISSLCLWSPIYKRHRSARSSPLCIFPSTLPVFPFLHRVCSVTVWKCSTFQEWNRGGRMGLWEGWWGGGRREGQVAGRLSSVAGLVKLIDEKG